MLCGGLGRRLRPVVSDRPKPLAEVSGRPFLEHLLERLAAQGFGRFLLAAGYRGEMIRDHFDARLFPYTVETAMEPEPLGTAGALRFVEPRLTDDPVLVANGDTWCGADLSPFARFHAARAADASIVLVRQEGGGGGGRGGAGRYGLVEIAPDGAISAFYEKEEKGEGGGSGWINAGLYLLSRRRIREIPEGRAVSLERDCFPSWIGRGLFGFTAEAPFLDIGLPEDYRRAGEFFLRGGHA